MASYDDFSISLLDVGDPSACAYAWFCYPCALASARSNLDDSHWMYNMFCLGHVAERWMIRTAYNIPGGGGQDCVVACCCFPCSANQLYQTTKTRGNPTVNGGRSYNKERFERPVENRGVLKRFCCAVFCNPCTTGHAVHMAVGMPFWMGCMCTNMCTARNIIRYQHRIIGHDFLDECVLPSLIVLATGAALFFMPLLVCVAPVVVARSMQLQAQAEARPTQSSRYLVNDSIRQIPVYVDTVQVIHPSVVSAEIVPVANDSNIYANQVRNFYNSTSSLSIGEEKHDNVSAQPLYVNSDGSTWESGVAARSIPVAVMIRPTGSNL